MSNRSLDTGTSRSVDAIDPGRLDRWILTPIAVGTVFAGVQVQHTFEMVSHGVVAVVLEAVVPLVLAVGLAATGPWLHWRGYDGDERRRITVWMAVVGVLVGLLFGWGLSHLFLLGHEFPHAHYVTTITLIAGSLLGVVVGVYDVRTRRHRRAIEAERETVARQRSRLSVLNRVLRHNLRNEATVVLGITEELADRTDGDAADLAATAHARTDDLVSLGEKARRIEAVTETDGFETVELHAAVTAVIEPFESRSGEVTFTVDVPADLEATTNERILARVLEELVENAVEHAGTGPPRVRVSARERDDDVEITVADDGPGIPDHERESLRAGVETALDHGSGLGLWLATWGVETLGGELTVGESEWGGGAVRIRIPEEAPKSGTGSPWTDTAGTEPDPG